MADSLQCLFCEKTLMRSYHDIREGKQSCHGRTVEDLIGHIFIDKTCLFFIDVQTYRKEFSITDSLYQIVCFDQTAS